MPLLLSSIFFDHIQFLLKNIYLPKFKPEQLCSDIHPIANLWCLVQLETTIHNVIIVWIFPRYFHPWLFILFTLTPSNANSGKFLCHSYNNIKTNKYNVLLGENLRLLLWFSPRAMNVTILWVPWFASAVAYIVFYFLQIHLTTTIYDGTDDFPIKLRWKQQSSVY